MPIKPFDFKDSKATFQIPIPGVPGAYGEIELNAKNETATIALGGEVPVPFLDDKFNGEIQVEINKEGEIAYGIEINLAGLKIESMVRGCDIVTEVKYGKLKTTAIYTIPDCEKVEEPLQPEPPQPPGDDENWEKEEPLPIPDWDDEQKISVLVFTESYFRQVVSFRTEEITSYTHTVSIDFPGQTEWHEIRGFKKAPMAVGSTASRTTPISESFGYNNGVASWRIWNGYNWYIPRYRTGLIYGTPAYHGGTYDDENMIGGMFPSHLYKSSSRPYWADVFHWVYVGTLGALRGTLAQDPKARGWYSSCSVGSANGSFSVKRKAIFKKLNENKKPPLQGEPPMKDCCADIKAELRRLRKELKEIKTDFVEPIHQIVNPEGFTESILPPKYDEKGEKIKPGDEAITLPDVLKELGGSGNSGTYDPQIAKVENQNIPVSWKEVEPPIKQNLPEEKVGSEWIYREMFTLLHEIRYALDPHDIRETEIPSRFIYPGISEGYEKIRNYPELFKNMFLMLDKVGFQPFQVQVNDVNPAVAGNQTEIHQFHSMGAALESTIKYLIDIEGDQDAHTSFLVRLAYEIIVMHQINADTQQTVQNIQDFLGYEVKKKKESIPMAFNPLADNPSARNDVDQNTEESIEKLLPNLLKNGNAQITVDEYVGRKDLIDFLFEILNAARQKPKGNRLA